MQRLAGLRASSGSGVVDASAAHNAIVDVSQERDDGDETEADDAVQSAQQRWRRRYNGSSASSSSAFVGTREMASSRQVNLYTFDPQDSRRSAYVETKIGGHLLDHKRFFYPDKQQIREPLKTAVWAMAANLFSGRSSSPAYQITKHDVLDYAATKIGGHPLDHVPFINRGQPSRPLLGYVPSLKPLFAPPEAVHPTAAAVAAAAYIGRNPANLYDCSRCLRMRQSPRVQLSCSHPVCASCVSSRSMSHAESGEFCFLECAQCQMLVAIEAIVFSSQYAIRINAPTAKTLAEFVQRERGITVTSPLVTTSAATAASGLSSIGWKYGGIVALLAFATRKLYPDGLKQKARAAIDSESDADASLLDDVAALSKDSIAAVAVAAVEDTVENGAARWQKRVLGLKAPSKLLKYEFVKTLGIGNFAEVMLVKSRRKGALSVLKESDKLQEAVNEIHILSKIRSPHVVCIFQYFIEEVGHRHFAYIDMEYCDRGDLAAYLKEKGPMDAATFDSFFRQLCLGLQEIHENGVIHRDLKPGNVLLTSDGVAKIADFGVSTWLESDLLTHHAAGTVAFMAPEVRRYFLGEAVSYDTKADIWSLGALAFTMLTGDPEPRVATRPLEELVEGLRERGVDEKHVKLIEQTLHPEPSGRASLKELLTMFPSMSSKL